MESGQGPAQPLGGRLVREVLVVLYLAPDVALDDDAQDLEIQAIELDVRVQLIERRQPLVARRIFAKLAEPEDLVHAMATLARHFLDFVGLGRLGLVAISRVSP